MFPFLILWMRWGGTVRFLRDKIGGDVSMDSAMDREQRLPWQVFGDL